MNIVSQDVTNSPVVEAEKRVLVGKIFVQAEFSYIASLYHVEPPKKNRHQSHMGKTSYGPFCRRDPINLRNLRDLLILLFCLKQKVLL